MRSRGAVRGAPHGGPRGNLHPWRFPWRMTWRTAWKPPRSANPMAARCGGPPRIFLQNCRLRGDAPHSFTGSGVSDLFFAFLALPVEFSSLLITKKCYILRFVSKDPSREHLKRSRLSRLVRPVSWPCNHASVGDKSCLEMRARPEKQIDTWTI